MGSFDVAHPNILFDKETHTYTRNGIEYPSVTTILADAGIIQKDKYPEYAAFMGTDVHKLLQLADEDDLDFGSLTPEQWQHYEAWVKICGYLGLTHPKHEMYVFHDVYKYAGTLDVIDGDTLVEIKSGRKERWHRLQVVAYKMAYETVYGKLKKVAIAYTKLGTADVLEDDTSHLEDVFLSVLNVARWKNESRRRKSRDTEHDE